MVRRWVFLFLLTGLLAGLAPAPVTAIDTRTLVIESFHADIMVFRDGTLEVTETIRTRFTGQWNGIFRFLPIEYRTPQGFNYTLRVTLQSITDENGRELEYRVSRERHNRKFRIRIPGARDATRTVIIKYQVANGLRYFEEYDELYWNVTGDESGFPIEASSARVTLPPDVTGIRAVAFTGGFGSSEQAAEIVTDSFSAGIRATRSLNLREGLTVAVAWDKGFVAEPTLLQKIGFFFFSNWPFFFPVGVFGIMYWLWHTRGRDPRQRSIVPRYEPPDGMSPAEIGTLIDNSPDMRDITAIIVDMAVRGFLEIEEKEESKWLGLSSGTEYVFHLKKQREEWNNLKGHERELLIELFDAGGRSVIEMSELENSFYTALPGIKDDIFQRLMDRKYYDHRPDKVLRSYLVAGALIGFFSVWGGGFLSSFFGVSMLTFVIAGIASGVIIAGFGLIMPARTMAGARALENVKGLEEFLTRVESDRFKRMTKTPEMFEKLLPYAMALGVEGKWAAAFASIYKEPPNWYRSYRYGPGLGFHMHGFTHGLSSMSTRAGSVMTSAPRSSGGSGFGGGGGGGFSGGGFGGGGTGGW